MATKLPLLFVISLACVAHGTHEASALVSQSSLAAMEKVFLRSEETHQSSMVAITKNLATPESALKALQRMNMTSPALIQVTHMALGKNSNLRQPKGYAGVEGARKLLNDMIFESMSKYDAEIAKCTEFYSKQCALMGKARGEISAANYLAAESRKHILSSQGTINRCQEDIPTRKLTLKQHNLKCRHELKKMYDRLKIVLGDIAVLTMILKMTDCDKKMLMQEEIGLMRCHDNCTNEQFVSFTHTGLKKQISQLQSSVSRQLTKDAFADLLDGVEDLQHVEMEGDDVRAAPSLMQDEEGANPFINKTKFKNPPTPRTRVPLNPCRDKYKGAPGPSVKRAAKCTIKKSPQCYKLQERFLLIQSGVKDEKDELLSEIDKMKKNCKETKETLETQIKNDQTMLNNAQTKLASATQEEANAGETARQTNKEHNELEKDLKSQMKTCNANYINFETELCALKKIRGEVFKMKGSGHSAFFQDCAVSKWKPEECTKKCGGGEQKLIRNVMTHPNRGAKCLPLAAMRKCNRDPCPVNCKLHQWSGWSKCSAECGGGVMQRLRDVKLAMKFGGKPCGSTSESKACNAQACEKDCSLGRWTRWSKCSKDCDGGTMKRQRYVKSAPRGDGKCPGKWSIKRLEYKKCNMKRCELPAPTAKVANPPKTLTCKAKLDVVLLLDGSGSLGKRGWKAEMVAAQTFIDAFNQPNTQAHMSVILYSGPRTWGGVYKCIGRNRKKVDQVKVCRIKTITHFTDDLKKVKQLVAGLSWPRGSTLTSIALLTAKAELALGRKDAKSVIVIITDGRPLSYRATFYASRYVRTAARLIWVPVTRYAPLRSIKRWATRRWQENVVPVKSFKKLEKPDVITHLIANMCPKKSRR